MRSIRWWLLVLSFALALPAAAQKSEEEAGDVSEVDKDAIGPLRARVRPVSGHLFLMQKRFEFSPTLGVSFRDAFFTKFLFGAALTYHFTEEFALSLRGGYNATIRSGGAQKCFSAATATPSDPIGCRLPTMEELTQLNTSSGVKKANVTFGYVSVLSSLDFQWAPIYGKLSLVAEKFLYFNMYGLIGPALVMYGPTSSVTVGGNVGVGFRFFANRWLTVRTELRDVIYYETGASTSSLRNQLMFELGLSMFFPMDFKEGADR